MYFLAGLGFGTIAYLTNSILPSIAVHIFGDLVFFTLVWPNDADRPLVWEAGAGTWFWLHAVQTVAFGILAIFAFRSLAHTARRAQPRVGTMHIARCVADERHTAEKSASCEAAWHLGHAVSRY